MMMMCLILKYKRIPKVMLLRSEVLEAWKSWEASQHRTLSPLAFCPERTGTSRVSCLFAAKIFFFFGCATSPAGSNSPIRDWTRAHWSRRCLPQWKRGVLTTGLPWKTLANFSFPFFPSLLQYRTLKEAHDVNFRKQMCRHWQICKTWATRRSHRVLNENPRATVFR